MSATLDLTSQSIVLPLSGDKKTLFALEPSMTVQKLKYLVSEEDQQTTVDILTKEGFSVAKHTKLGVLLSQPTQLVLNGQTFPLGAVRLQDSPSAPVSSENGAALVPPTLFANAQPSLVTSGVKPSQSVNVDPSADSAIAELLLVQKELEPLETRKAEVDLLAGKRAQRVVWYGAIGLVAQWCFLARLTWWDLNWDIMEPVTYFITTGTAILTYFYFAFTRAEFTYDSWFYRINERKRARLYARQQFDIERYAALKAKYDLLESSLSPLARLKFRQIEFETDKLQENNNDEASPQKQ